MYLKEEFRSKTQTIHRVRPTSDETAPWAGIAFIQDVGSDKLSDQLKHDYPQVANLRQRKHMAAIDFLKGELEGMQPQNERQAGAQENDDNVSTIGPPSNINDFAHAYFDGSRPQSAASHTSPSITSVQASPRLPELSQQAADQTNSPEAPMVAIPTASQTFVFSLADGRTMQPKTKRKMTMQERYAYKERRKKGACMKCRRTKGKCTHDEDAARGALSDGVDVPERSAKRSSSPITSPDGMVPIKQPRTEGGSTARESLENTRGTHAKLTTRFSQTTPPSSTTSFAMGPADGNEPWEKEQTAVYVPNSQPSEQLPEPLPGENDADWYPPNTNLDHFDAAYLEDGSQIPNQPFASPPLDDGPSESFPFQFDFSPVTSPWINGHDPQVGDTG